MKYKFTLKNLTSFDAEIRHVIQCNVKIFKIKFIFHINFRMLKL